MSRNNFVTWTAIITVFLVWHLFGRSVFVYIYLSLIKLGFPVSIIQLIMLVLPLILLMEIVTKFLFLQVAMPPLKFVSTKAELWEHLDQNELIRYTSELEQLGFVHLTDFTSPSSKGMARLFAHPQKFCFAEVYQVSSLPMFCSISCHLEKQWLLTVTNTSSLAAVSYAFFRQPRNLVKRVENASANLLLQSLLNWRKQVSSDLDLELIRDIKAETYFAKARNTQIERRRSLLRKSIIWGLLEMLWFSCSPKFEWLGDYSKCKGKL